MNPFLFRTFCFAFALASSVAAASDKPPVAPVRPVTDDYFGTKIVDDYRYFEDKDDADAKAWMKAQAEHTRARLDALPGRAGLLKRFEQLYGSQPARVEGLQIVGGQYYTLRTPRGAQSPKLYVRDRIDGPDRLLVDPEKFSGANGAHVSINAYVPSPDNRYVIYGLSEGGSEAPTLHVLDRKTGKDLPETIDRSLFGLVAWRPDSRAFFYSRLQKLKAGMPATAKYENSRVWLHELGTQVGKDRAVAGIGISDARIPLKAAEIPLLETAPGSRHAIIWVTPGTDRRLRAYVAPLDQIGREGGTPWRAIAASYDDQIVGTSDAEGMPGGLHGDTLYAVSRKRSPKGEVLAIDLRSPDLAKARVVAPAGGLPIAGLYAGKDELWLLRMDAGVKQAERLAYTAEAKPRAVALPFAANVDAVVADVRSAAVALDVTSWTHAPTWLDHDARRGTVRETSLRPLGAFDILTDVQVEDVKVKSHDGVEVPLTIVHRRGIALDGSHPVFLYSYGAYGISLTPYYEPRYLADFDHGFVIAIAHVRGGGEYGEAWHQGGFQQTKPNTWKDFIACAEYLVDRKYTTPGKLAIAAASAGGILVGRAMEERPDLFAAVIADVPVTDTLRYETTANGPPNIPEFGSVKTKAGFHALLAMSPYANIEDGVKYPAVLVTTGANDPRVDSWEPAKFAARLQAATAGDKPVLLRVDYYAGHGIDSTVRQQIELATDKLAFLLWQLGDPDFQPK